MKTILLAISIGLFLTRPARASLITFDDINPADVNKANGQIPQGYGGFGWNQFYVSGQNGSGAAGALANWYYVPAFTTGGRGSFDLNSADLAWSSGAQQVEVVGKSGRAVLYDKTYILSSTVPTWCGFNYIGIDTVLFFAPTGSSCYFTMDNLVVNESSGAVPESGTWLAGVLMLFPLGISAIRKLRNCHSMTVQHQ